MGGHDDDGDVESIQDDLRELEVGLKVEIFLFPQREGKVDKKMQLFHICFQVPRLCRQWDWEAMMRTMMLKVYRMT